MSVAAELCAACGHVGIEARGFCPRCGARGVAVGTVPGDGAVWSLTMIHRPPSSAGELAEPYAVAMIALAAGPRLMARVPAELRIGDPVVVRRETLDGDTTLVIPDTYPSKG